MAEGFGLSVHRASAALAASIAAATLAGCVASSVVDDEPGYGGPVRAPSPVTSLAWAHGREIHVGETTWVTSGTARELAPVADGVFAVIDHDLVWSTPEQTLVVTELGGFGGSLSVSADGRYLGYIDQASGEKDDYDTPIATAVVVDLATGAEVLRTTEGMGEVESDDLAALYPEVNPIFLGFDGNAGYYTMGETYRVSLPTGEVQEYPTNPDSMAWGPAWPGAEQFLKNNFMGHPGWPYQRSTETPGSIRNAATGERVPLTIEGYRTFIFEGWLDRTRAYGVFLARPAGEPAGRSVLATCDLDAVTCKPLGDEIRISPGEPIVWGPPALQLEG